MTTTERHLDARTETWRDASPDPRAERQLPVRKVIARIISHEPRPFFVSSALFFVFFMMPALIGWFLSAGFGAVEQGDSSRAYLYAGLLVVAEIVRMASIHAAVPRFTRSWVHMLTFQRGNMLIAQLSSGGDDAGRPTMSAGEAITHFRDDVEDSNQMIDLIVDSVGGAMLTLVMGVVLGFASLAGAVIMVVPVTMVTIVTLLLFGQIREYRLADRVAASRVSGLVGDTVSAATTLKVNDAIEPVVAELDRRAEVRLRTAVRDRVLNDALQRFGDSAMQIGIGAVVVVAAGAFANGTFDVAQLALFISYAGWMAFFPRVLGRMLAARRQIGVTYDRMSSLVADRRHANVVQARDLPIADYQTAPRPVERRPERVPLERLDVVGLGARYGDITVFDGVDLAIGRGEFIVITGGVATGKSTLLRALLGLASAAEVTGEVRWNGEPLADRASFLVPPNAAYLAQVPQLISDSVADNIALGTVPDGAVEAALDIAELTDDLAGMPDGLDTMIGPRGLRLSGGQRQRLAAARAIVRRPELLILDDLSSAVDVETEQRLWDRFAKAGLTVIAVSHRQIAFERADRVYRMTDGNLVDQRPVR